MEQSIMSHMYEDATMKHIALDVSLSKFKKYRRRFSLVSEPIQEILFIVIVITGFPPLPQFLEDHCNITHSKDLVSFFFFATVLGTQSDHNFTPELVEMY